VQPERSGCLNSKLKTHRVITVIVLLPLLLLLLLVAQLQQTRIGTNGQNFTIANLLGQEPKTLAN